MHNWSDLLEKGFLVIPSFLSEQENAHLAAEFAAIPKATNANYNVKRMLPETVRKFAKKINSVTKQVFDHTGIQTDVCTGALFFAIEMGINIDWHQDHESYYEYQDHFNYLNFYIPVKKPHSEKSNLSLIPFDALQAADPELAGARKGRGACRAVCKDGKTSLLDDNSGNRMTSKADFNSLAVTPHLSAGDLLLMRGDVFHKTQDRDSERVAASFRTVNSNGVIKRSEFQVSCQAKQIMMKNNPVKFKILEDFFLNSTADELRVKDYLPMRR